MPISSIDVHETENKTIFKQKVIRQGYKILFLRIINYNILNLNKALQRRIAAKINVINIFIYDNLQLFLGFLRKFLRYSKSNHHKGTKICNQFVIQGSAE
jgi:hypothetical protein